MIGLALTPEQFTTLLRMVYIGNTVTNAHRDEDEFIKEYDDFEQYMFARAKDVGFPAATWRHEVNGVEHHHPSVIFENDEVLTKIIDEYDLSVTLEVLAEKLAERDVERKHGPFAKKRLPEADYEDLVDEIAEAYETIFLAQGFEGISVHGIS
jgi:sarcosine oxidase delta subunit